MKRIIDINGHDRARITMGRRSNTVTLTERDPSTNKEGESINYALEDGVEVDPTMGLAELRDWTRANGVEVGGSSAPTFEERDIYDPATGTTRRAMSQVNTTWEWAIDDNGQRAGKKIMTEVRVGGRLLSQTLDDFTTYYDILKSYQAPLVKVNKKNEVVEVFGVEELREGAPGVVTGLKITVRGMHAAGVTVAGVKATDIRRNYTHTDYYDVTGFHPDADRTGLIRSETRAEHPRGNVTAITRPQLDKYRRAIAQVRSTVTDDGQQLEAFRVSLIQWGDDNTSRTLEVGGELDGEGRFKPLATKLRKVTAYADDGFQARVATLNKEYNEITFFDELGRGRRLLVGHMDMSGDLDKNAPNLYTEADLRAALARAGLPIELASETTDITYNADGSVDLKNLEYLFGIDLAAANPEDAASYRVLGGVRQSDHLTSLGYLTDRAVGIGGGYRYVIDPRWSIGVPVEKTKGDGTVIERYTAPANFGRPGFDWGNMAFAVDNIRDNRQRVEVYSAINGLLRTIVSGTENGRPTQQITKLNKRGPGVEVGGDTDILDVASGDHARLYEDRRVDYDIVTEEVNVRRSNIAPLAQPTGPPIPGVFSVENRIVNVGGDPLRVELAGRITVFDIDNHTAKTYAEDLTQTDPARFHLGELLIESSENIATHVKTDKLWYDIANNIVAYTTESRLNAFSRADQGPNNEPAVIVTGNRGEREYVRVFYRLGLESGQDISDPGRRTAAPGADL